MYGSKDITKEKGVPDVYTMLFLISTATAVYIYYLPLFPQIGLLYMYIGNWSYSHT